VLKRIVLYAGLITFGMVLSLHAQPQSLPTPASPFKRTILQRADVPGTNLELILATVDIAPRAKAGRHTHPGMTMAVIEEGDFWVRLDGGPEQVLHVGGSTSNPNRAVHDEGSLDKPVKLTAVYVVEKGQPLASPAP